MRGPVERTEKRARRHGRVAPAQRAAPDAAGHQRADAALVAIAFGDDERAQAGGEGVDLEVRGGSFDAVDEAQDMGDGEGVEARAERAGAPCPAEREQEPVERAILAEEQDFVLAAKVVVQVARREVGGGRDVAHAGGGEAAAAEDARGGAQDVEAPGVRAGTGARGTAGRTN